MILSTLEVCGGHGFLPFILFAFQVFGSTEECIWLELGIIILLLGFPSKPKLLFHRILLALRCVYPFSPKMVWPGARVHWRAGLYSIRNCLGHNFQQ